MNGLRVDKWLWFARFARTRSLAAKLCSSGQVTIGGAVVMQPSRPVRVGDAITVQHGRVLRRVTVRALGERRGPPAEAQRLYVETEPPQPLAALAAWEPLIESDG